jgi:SM-20-related protein
MRLAAAGMAMTTFELSSALGLFVRRDFLPTELCARASRRMRTAPGADVVPNDGSPCEQARAALCVEPDAAVGAAVAERLRAALPELSVHFRVDLSSLGTPRFLRFEKGDFLAFHRDRGESVDEPAAVRSRQVTAVLFLNSESERPGEGRYGGGALEFYLPDLLPHAGYQRARFSFPARPGTLVAFDSRVRHQVRPVTHGQRHTAVTWFG